MSNKFEGVLNVLDEMEVAVLAHLGAKPGWGLSSIKIDKDGFMFELENERGYFEGGSRLSPKELMELIA